MYFPDSEDWWKQSGTSLDSDGRHRKSATLVLGGSRRSSCDLLLPPVVSPKLIKTQDAKPPPQLPAPPLLPPCYLPPRWQLDASLAIHPPRVRRLIKMQVLWAGCHHHVSAVVVGWLVGWWGEEEEEGGDCIFRRHKQVVTDILSSRHYEWSCFTARCISRSRSGNENKSGK